MRLTRGHKQIPSQQINFYKITRIATAKTGASRKDWERDTITGFHLQFEFTASLRVHGSLTSICLFSLFREKIKSLSSLDLTATVHLRLVCKTEGIGLIFFSNTKDLCDEISVSYTGSKLQ